MSGKKVVKPPIESGKKPPKPLPSKRPKFPTPKSTFGSKITGCSTRGIRRSLVRFYLSYRFTNLVTIC
jgi:hypothetical protein